MEPTIANKPVVAQATGKIEKSNEKVLVRAGDQPLTLLSLDVKVAELLFDGREDFVVMSEAEIRQLSAENKRRYAAAQQQHEIWMANTSSVLESEFSTAQFTGRATDKINDLELDPNFAYRWTDPKKVQERLKIGWTIVQAGEMRSYLGPTKNHHEIGNKGQTELVMMKMPKALWDKRQKAKAEKNRLAAGAAATRFDQDARSAGMKVVTDDPKDGRSWNELQG